MHFYKPFICQARDILSQDSMILVDMMPLSQTMPWLADKIHCVIW